MILEAGKVVNWIKSNEYTLKHIGFDTVQGEDGGIFNANSGDIMQFVDLLDEAKTRVAK